MADRFFTALRDRLEARVACEPRHPRWFSADAEALLIRHRVARVAADPARVPDAAEPGGWRGLVYRRLHGSPRMYYSDYDAAALAAIGSRLDGDRGEASAVWCIFDNTTLGHALGNALAVAARAAAPLRHDAMRHSDWI